MYIPEIVSLSLQVLGALPEEFNQALSPGQPEGEHVATEYEYRAWPERNGQKKAVPKPGSPLARFLLYHRHP